MKYQEAIKKSMEMLSEDERTIFIGYNISYGSKAYGTLTDIPDNKKIETPVTENLMTGLAIGSAIENLRPVLFFERHDFMLIALDAIINHLDKIDVLSKEQYKLPVIIRATVGSNKPLGPGPQHTQDFTELFKRYLKHIKVIEPRTPKEILSTYESIKNYDSPVLIIERKDLYDVEEN